MIIGPVDVSEREGRDRGRIVEGLRLKDQVITFD